MHSYVLGKGAEDGGLVGAGLGVGLVVVVVAAVLAIARDDPVTVEAAAVVLHPPRGREVGILPATKNGTQCSSGGYFS